MQSKIYILSVFLLCSWFSNAYSNAIDLSNSNELSSCLPAPPPPSNDTPCSAQDIELTDACNFTETSLSEATPSGISAPSCGNYNNHNDIWFKTTTNDLGFVIVKINSVALSMNIAVYKGACDALEEVACVTGNQINIDDLTPNTDIWIRLWEDNNIQNTFSICVFANTIENDTPCSAMTVNLTNECNFIQTSFVTATPSGVPAPSCGSYNNQKDIWFKTTSGSLERLMVETESDGLNIKIALYEGTCEDLTEISCDDWHMAYTTIEAGTDVWIRVWEENNQSGFFKICIYEPEISRPENYTPYKAKELNVYNDCHPILGTTLYALPSQVNPPSCSTGAFDYNDVWFKADVPPSGHLTINIQEQGMTAAGVTIYKGNCNNLTEKMCFENQNEIPSPINITPNANLDNQTIYIRIWNVASSGAGSFKICAYEEPPLEVVTGIFSSEQLVEMLVNGCLQADNIQYDGDERAIGYFTNGMNDLRMKSGLVMASGHVQRLLGENNHDANLNYISNHPNIVADLKTVIGEDIVKDASILEFDFIPSTSHTEFSFVFSSEEYPEFVGQYNDVFAFFISGPGINGVYSNNADNIAVVPNTNTPITINSINNTTNSNYYVGNTAGDFPFYMNGGGVTFPLKAVMDDLIPCETYHIVFAIADAGDASYNSYVFFEENSFTSGGRVAMNNVSTVGQVNQIYEGCSNHYVFSRLDNSEFALLDTAWIYLSIGGTATPEIDYTPIEDTLMLLPGMYSDTVEYKAILDELDEDDEYIVFTLSNGCPCNLELNSDTIWIKNNYNIEASITDNILICRDSSITINTTVNPNLDSVLLQYEWNTQDTTPSITNIAPPETTTYKVTITNRCKEQEMLETTVYVIPYIDPRFSLAKDTICVGEPLPIDFIGSCTDSADFVWNFETGIPNTSTVSGPHSVQWFETGYKTISLKIDDNGCTASYVESVYLKKYDDLKLMPSSTNLTCAGSCDGTATVTSAITGVYSYLWDDGQVTSTAVNLCPRNYKVTVTNMFGCMDTTHTSVVSPTPITTIVESDSVQCFGSNEGKARVAVDGGILPYEYHWSNGSSSSENNFLYAGIYQVTVSDANGCQKVDQVEVFQPDAIAISVYANTEAPQDIWSCIGDTVVVTAAVTGGSSPYQFLWNDGQTTDTIVISAVETRSYSLQVKDQHNCVSQVEEFPINIYPPLSIAPSVSFDDHTICLGDNINLSVLPEGGNGQYTIELITNSGVEEVGSSILITPSVSQTYTIKLSDNCNTPSVTQDINVTVNTVPSASFTSDVTEACTPTYIHLTENTEDDDCDYQWIVSNGSSSFSSFDKDASFLLNQSGFFNVKLVKTNHWGCKTSVIKNDYINLLPKPTALFSYSQDNQSANTLNTTFYFQNDSRNSSLFYWAFNESDSSRLENPTYRFPALPGEYMVNLRAENDFGCYDTISQVITIEEYPTLFVPTAFTPNKDGLNDEFKVLGRGLLKKDFSLKIYDRWGHLIKEINTPEGQWNGTDGKGNQMPIGTYYWKLSYTNANNIAIKRSGEINLLR